MNDGETLLKCILARPDDVTLRLAYADCLQEHDDPDRAEFIRLQCRNVSDDLDVLTERETELLGSRGPDWAAEIHGRGVHSVNFRRGFVEVVSATAHAFTSRGGSWCARTPLREADLTAAAGKVGRVAAVPHARSLTSLKLTGARIGDKDLERLAASPHFPNLSSLSISGPSGYRTRVGDRGVTALAGAAFYSNLVRLSIDGSAALGSAGLAALAGVHSRLQHLVLSHTAIGDEGAQAFAAANYPALRLLVIYGSRIGGEGLVSLANAPGLTGLTHLSVECGGVTGAHLLALARAGCRPGMQLIDLSHNPLGVVDVGAVTALLAANQGLSLDLEECDIPRRVQENLARRFPDHVWVDVMAG